MAEIPFQEAIDFVAGKVNLPTQKWDDLRHGAHVRGFSVAGVTRDDMLADFRAAIEKARAEGTGFKAFQKTFNEIVDRTGWQFNARGVTEEQRRAWRARIIYTTNMRTSYMAGRYKQLTDPDVQKYRPYWQYVHSGAKHPRKMHLAWDGLVLRADDPWWNVHYPPNGWGCGCDVEALSERELKRLGKSGPDQAPTDEPYAAKDPRTGEDETRYPGIDRGWEYNVGQSWLDGMVPKDLQKPLPAFGAQGPPAELPPLPAPTSASPGDLLPRGLDPERYVSAFMGRFGLGAKEAGFFRDKAGEVLTIDRSLFESRAPDGAVLGLKVDKRGRGQFAGLIAEAIRSPDEIWVDWASVKSGVVLRRAYLRRVTLPDGSALFVRFEWTKYGWVTVTGFDTTEDYLKQYRVGALIYRRKD